MSGLRTVATAEASQWLMLLADLTAVGGFELAEVQVSVELTASGGVNLIAGAKGAIQLKFKPPERSAAS